MKLLLPTLLLGAVAGRAQAPAATPVAADTAQYRFTAGDVAKAVALNQGIFRDVSGEVHTSVGYGAARYGSLNALLAGQGLPTLAASQLTYGFGFGARLRRVVLGLDGLLHGQTQEAAGYRLTAGSSTAVPYLGYAWFSRYYEQAFVPTLGLGLSTFDLTVAAAATGSSATTLLAGPAYARTLHYRSSSLALGLTYDVYPFDADVLKRCVLGIRLRYLVRLGTGRYYADDFQQPVAGPGFDPLVFSARAVVGFCL